MQHDEKQAYVCILARSALCMLLPSSLMSIRTHRVTNNLKEYAVKALVNTVDHLGSISFKVSSLIDQRFSEATDADLRISCIHQVFSVQKPSSSSFFFLLILDCGLCTSPNPIGFSLSLN